MLWRGVLSVACGFGLVACGARPPVSALKYDSAVNAAYDGVITDGNVITDSADPAAARAEAIDQLRYAIGQLNGESAGLDLAHADITLGATTTLSSGRFSVAYSAKILVSWPRGQAPARYQLLLPARGDGTGRQQFTDDYAIQTNFRSCLADDAHDVDPSSFWYYYRPYARRCPVLNAGGDVRRTVLALSLSAQNTSGKAPEYGKIWEDGKLVITGVFSKYEAGTTTDADVGIAGFERMYDSLLQRFGAPTATSLPAGQAPSAVNNDIRLTFDSANGPVDVAMFLVDNVTGVDAAFAAKFAERTLISDFVVYDGHAGLGANIAALSRLGQFAAGQYQIYMLNGCDSFAYYDDTLKLAHQAVNPGAGPDKFLDVIVNARPAEFGYMAMATMSVIDALVTPGPTYREILARFDDSQLAGVTGESDNNWPQPF